MQDWVANPASRKGFPVAPTSTTPIAKVTFYSSGDSVRRPLLTMTYATHDPPVINWVQTQCASPGLSNGAGVAYVGSNNVDTAPAWVALDGQNQYANVPGGGAWTPFTFTGLPAGTPLSGGAYLYAPVDAGAYFSPTITQCPPPAPYEPDARSTSSPTPPGTASPPRLTRSRIDR